MSFKPGDIVKNIWQEKYTFAIILSQKIPQPIQGEIFYIYDPINSKKNDGKAYHIYYLKKLDK